MIKFGIIGYGKMGIIRHEAVKKTRIGEVISVVGFGQDKVPDSLKADSVDALLANPEIEAVFICCINAYNKDLTIAALQAGKHVLCEKPPAFNAAEVEEIRAVEAKAGRVLMYGFNHRHHGAAIKMRQIIDEGEFGNVLWMRGRYGKSVDEGYLDTWRADPKLAGGGILIDQGIHMVDLFLHLGGEFDEIQSMVSNIYWNIPGIEDNVFAMFRNSKTGVAASLHSTMIQWRHLFSLEVFMERGYMVLNGLKTSSDSYGAEKLVIARNRTMAPAATWREETSELYEADESWEHEAEIFAHWIQSGQPKNHGGDSMSALRVMRVVDRIYAQERHTAPRLYSQLNASDQLVSL